jgi:hypothetical protein
MRGEMTRVLLMAVRRMKSGTMHRLMEDRIQGEILMIDVLSTLLAMVSCAITRGITQEECMEGMQEAGNSSSTRVTGSQALV